LKRPGQLDQRHALDAVEISHRFVPLPAATCSGCRSVRRSLVAEYIGAPHRPQVASEVSR
jgi:hypothetical protein